MVPVIRWPRLPRPHLPHLALPLDADDLLKLVAVLLATALLWWSALALGVAVWLFLHFSGLR